MPFQFDLVVVVSLFGHFRRFSGGNFQFRKLSIPRAIRLSRFNVPISSRSSSSSSRGVSRINGFSHSFAMRQDATESGLADLPSADVFVAVEMRSERAFGIVGVHHFDEVEAEYAVG